MSAMSERAPATNLATRADCRDVRRAIAAIERIEERHGEDWDDYDFDPLSSARAILNEWLTEGEMAL